jgi:hypothetical protein
MWPGCHVVDDTDWAHTGTSHSTAANTTSAGHQSAGNAMVTLPRSDITDSVSVTVVAQVLLLVVLDGADAAHGSIFGIPPRVYKRSSLPQQAPTLIEPLF